MQTTPVQGTHEDLAHQLWAMSQLAPGEGIEDAIQRITGLLTSTSPRPHAESKPLGWVVKESLRAFTDGKACGITLHDELSQDYEPVAVYAHPAQSTSQDVSGLMASALKLCDAVENIKDLPQIMYALQAGKAVNELRDCVAAMSVRTSEQASPPQP